MRKLWENFILENSINKNDEISLNDLEAKKPGGLGIGPELMNKS